MGMAASQARFLSLTARKSNVEYQGQQVNQQRTSLANESANIYAQLQDIEVPTPPVVRDYMQTKYTFTTNALSGENASYSLMDIDSTPDGDFALLSYNKKVFQSSYNWDVSLGKKVNNDGTISNVVYDPFGRSFNLESEPAANYASSLEHLKDVSGFDSYFQDGNLVENSNVYFYKDKNKTYFLPLSNGLDSSNNLQNASYLTAYSIESVTEASKVEYPVEKYMKNDLGRLTSITLNLSDDEDNPRTMTFELDCMQVEDEDAYDQAMLDYNYQKAKYDKQISDLNSKTEAIQQKDRTLEIKLKQLDTEQNAIKTEMDAVKKVTSDNVESTFKTFG